LESAGEIEFELFDEQSPRGLAFFKFEEIDLSGPLNAWIDVEPQGKLQIQMNFGNLFSSYFYFLFDIFNPYIKQLNMNHRKRRYNFDN